MNEIYLESTAQIFQKTRSREEKIDDRLQTSSVPMGAAILGQLSSLFSKAIMTRLFFRYKNTSRGRTPVTSTELLKGME